eukprot:2641950-Rhodomonas_salina.2
MVTPPPPKLTVCEQQHKGTEKEKERRHTRGNEKQSKNGGLTQAMKENEVWESVLWVGVSVGVCVEWEWVWVECAWVERSRSKRVGRYPPCARSVPDIA